MFRRILWLIPLLLLAAYAFLGIEDPDYRAGYNRAMEDVERARDELGWAAEVAPQVLPLLERLPTDNGQSPEWQEGYRAALQAAAEKKRR